MNKKWWKLGLILGLIALVVYASYELFFWRYLAEWRFIKEEKIATKVYFQNKNTFDEIRLLSSKFPSFSLNLERERKINLTIKLEENKSKENYNISHFHEYHPQFLQGPIDTIISGEKWSIKIENISNDTTFQEGLIFFKNNFTKFEKMKERMKQINLTQISNLKDHSLNIQIKEVFCQGLQYSFYYLKTLEYQNEHEVYWGEKIDDFFYFNIYSRNDFFCCFKNPTWIPHQ